MEADAGLMGQDLHETPPTPQEWHHATAADASLLHVSGHLISFNCAARFSLKGASHY